MDKELKETPEIPFEKKGEKDFHVKTIQEEELIDDAEGLDDEEEFNCDMQDLGDFDDLPDSDKAMIGRSQKCNK